MSRSSSSSAPSFKDRHLSDVHAAVLGECGYCGHTILAKKHKPLPLECFNCKGVYHVSCLRGKRPQVLLGDQLFKFTCAYCSPMGRESCDRPYLQWVHITHLALYNLMVGRRSPAGRVRVAKEGGEKKEYFRWNEDICGFIRTHWNKLMPDRKRTQSWRSTVAGTLSVNCPAVFQSGHALFNEHGWWTLTSITPPDPRQAVILSPPALGKRTSMPLSPPPPKRSCNKPDVDATKAATSSSSKTPPTCETPPPMDEGGLKVIETVDHSALPKPRLVHLTERQEKVLKTHLEKCSQAVGQSPRAARLLRKLKVRELQRNYGHPMFDIDKYVTMATAQTMKYVVDGTKSYYEQIVPLKKLTFDPSSTSINSSGPVEDLNLASGEGVLNRLSVVSHTLPHEPKLFEHFLNGRGYSRKPFSSPYTARVLKPFIFRTTDISPLRVKLNSEIVHAYAAKHSTERPVVGYVRQSVDFVYFREHMLSAVNCFVSHLFWSVDLSECLQYPDFTCVVLYGNLVIGCALMTPDVKVNEAYISFLAVHPDFQQAHIGKVMLYHLIQSCMGKDVTLHVSVNNPAMILYQKIGFKAERYCLDFYEHYYPSAHHMSKHAYYMRLKR